ncbi:MAG: hypothetical protein AAFY77_10725 [Pseudomonadota bacterium]
MDWPEDTGAISTPAHRAVLHRRLRRTVAELEALGVSVPWELRLLADRAPEADEDVPNPPRRIPR